MKATEQIENLADVCLDLEVELDSRTMPIDEILDLEVDTVVRMTRSAGENIDILIGGSVVGSGEIVIIEEAVGVRITDFRLES